MIGALLACAPDPVRYDGQVVAWVPVEDRADVEAIAALDLWSEHVGDRAWVRAHPRELARWGDRVEVTIPDVQAAIDAAAPRVPSPLGFFDDWRPLDELDAHLDELAARVDFASIEEVGLSREGRPIRALSLVVPGAEDRLSVVVFATQHAREWVAASSALGLAERLVDGYGVDPVLTAVLDQHPVRIVPVVNPDGYEYTWTTDRLWRKNRLDNGDGSFGVDLNRNWDAAWGGPGSAALGSSDNYRGEAPFSEPETLALAEWIEDHPRTGWVLDLHCTGQLALRPWAFTPTPAPDEDVLAAATAAAAAAMGAPYGTVYDEGPFHTRLYPGNGVAIDWAYGAQGQWAYLFELRDRGQYGFLLPADQIVPTTDEVLAGFLALLATPERPRMPLAAEGRLTAGDPIALRVWRASAGAEVEWYRSTDGLGQTVLADGVALELANAERFGVAAASDKGIATIGFGVPAGMGGRTVWFQARAGAQRSLVLAPTVGP
ncbi:MAG: M14 metallopeptidase family protein [Myxococcota bacterium]